MRGLTKGGIQLEKKTWWCNEKEQRTLKEKKKAYKNMKNGTDREVQEYKR